MYNLGQDGLHDSVVTTLGAYDVLQSVNDEPRGGRTPSASQIQYALDPQVIHHVFPQGDGDPHLVERRESAEVRLISLPSIYVSFDRSLFLGGDPNRWQGHGRPFRDE